MGLSASSIRKPGSTVGFNNIGNHINGVNLHNFGTKCSRIYIPIYIYVLCEFLYVFDRLSALRLAGGLLRGQRQRLR